MSCADEFTLRDGPFRGDRHFGLVAPEGLSFNGICVPIAVHPSLSGSTLRLAELVGGLTLAADFANGYPPEKCLRTAILAVAIGREAGLDEATLHDAYWVCLLRFLGCTAFAHEEAHAYGAGNDLSVRSTMGMADATNPIGTLRAIVTRIGEGSPAIARAKGVARLLLDRDAIDKHASSQCDVSIRLSEIVGVSDPVRAALAQVCERFDGKGGPHHIAGEALQITTRLYGIADILEVALHRGGVAMARTELALRSGKQFDPRLTKQAIANLDRLAALTSGTSVWDRFLEAEPAPHALRDNDDAALVATAFAHFADVKSVYTLGHSTRVADLAVRAGQAMRLDAGALADLRAAALLHDIGRVAVPNGIWDKAGALGPAEWERVRLHAYYTERIALRAPAWSRAARIAAGAHERPDASGYHRGVPAEVLSASERILAAADVFAALREPRAHRPAMSLARATAVMHQEVREKKLDREAVDALLEGKSRPLEKTSAAPKGLSDREVEVLRHLARGKTNREIGQLLGISPRTVQNHVANIYDKAGVYSRAGAALFATEHRLLRLDED